MEGKRRDPARADTDSLRPEPVRRGLPTERPILDQPALPGESFHRGAHSRGKARDPAGRLAPLATALPGGERARPVPSPRAVFRVSRRPAAPLDSRRHAGARNETLPGYGRRRASVELACLPGRPLGNAPRLHPGTRSHRAGPGALLQGWLGFELRVRRLRHGGSMEGGPGVRGARLGAEPGSALRGPEPRREPAPSRPGPGRRPPLWRGGGESRIVRGRLPGLLVSLRARGDPRGRRACAGGGLRERARGRTPRSRTSRRSRVEIVLRPRAARSGSDCRRPPGVGTLGEGNPLALLSRGPLESAYRSAGKCRSTLPVFPRASLPPSERWEPRSMRT
jgi:hypothetical protein